MKALWAIGLLMSGGLAVADPIPGLVSTGQGAPGSVEQNWTLLAGTAWITDQTNFPFPAWLANTTASRWISAQRSYAGLLSDPVGAVTYSLLFNLTGYTPSTATFRYRLAADNQVDAVRLNGVQISGTYRGFTSFSAPVIVPAGSGAFVPGQNQLEVVVRNDPGATGNPAGLRFEILSSDVQSIPEPSQLLPVLLALGAAAIHRRRATLPAGR